MALGFVIQGSDLKQKYVAWTATAKKCPITTRGLGDNL